jgi:hypothetical protein
MERFEKSAYRMFTPAFTLCAMLYAGAVPGTASASGFIAPALPGALSAARSAPAPGWLSPDGKGAPDLLYVGTAIDAPGAVFVYRQRGSNHRVGEITEGLGDPFGLFVDVQGNLYVANILNGTVTVYAPGATSPFETLTGTVSPDNVVVGLDGTVYVSDDGLVFDPSNGVSDVVEYAPGATTPTKTVVTLPHGWFAYGLGLDSGNHLYVAANRPQKGSRSRGKVLEFASDSSSGRDLGIRVGQAGGLTVDRNDNLILVDELANSIDVFRPGHKKPWKVFTINDNCCIVDVAINGKNDAIWVSGGFWGFVDGLTYPGGTLFDRMLHHTGWAFSVATSPAGSD